MNFEEALIKIEELISDYKKIRKELTLLTRQLDLIYDDEAYAGLDTLYYVEDKHFSKCIDAVCVFQEIITMHNRLDVTDANRFVVNGLAKSISKLDPVEASFYFDIATDLPEGEQDGNDDGPRGA